MEWIFFLCLFNPLSPCFYSIHYLHDGIIMMFKVKIPLTKRSLMKLVFVKLVLGWGLVFNATLNKISVTSRWSDLLVEETGDNHRPAASH